MSNLPAEAAPREPLAVIGLSCLFPKAADVAEFWSNVRRGVDAISEIPSTHWNPDDYFDADPKSPDMTYARRGGFLSPVAFDPLEFGIAPSNLEAIDTSQLLGLVGAKRALEDAGYGTDRQFDRARVGCILGVTGTLEMVIPLGARLGHPKWRAALKDAGVADDVAEDVIQRISEAYVPWQENSFPGLLGNVVAGRIANRLDLGGTNCVVDAACASSLSAMHLAALELWSGRAEMMITGGIDTFNDIFMYMCFSKTPALSPTGNAKPFSDDGDGTILGEGVGMFVLKRLSDAERDGDRIHAVIRGIGTSSDGAGNAVYAPKKEGQVRCLQNAYELAGVSPATVELIEAHGTGTKVGDATELAGLTEVFQSTAQAGRWCAVGSVKSQIGHTKAAAGAAGVLKAILALKHRVLPPTIKIDRPLPALCDGANPLYANTQARPWLPNAEHPRRAGVSAFGFGGSNFHCVLEESPTAPDIDWDDDVLFAAWSADSLTELASQLDDWKNLSDRHGVRRRAAQSRRQFQAHHEHRLVLVADLQTCDVPRLIETARGHLQKYADRANWSTPDGISYARGPRPGKLGMLFPGQGSQYVGMQRELACRFPALQEVLAEANEVFSTYATQRRPWRLSDYVYPLPVFEDESREKQEAALRDTEVAQPALGAVSLGLVAVLAKFGVRPEVVAGHSYGELTALCASRRFAPAALYQLSMLRGRLMAEAQDVAGGMLAVGAPLSQVEAALKEASLDLVIANRNGPSQVVLSGRISELDRAHETLSRRNIRGKRLPVAAAFHSPLVASAGERFRAVLEEIEFSAAELPVFANTHAEEYPADADEARSLLAGQLAQPVEFVRQIENMYDSGVRMFLEVGPGGVLTGLVGSILSDREFRACAIDSSSGKRSGMLDLALALGQISVAGYSVDLTAWDPLSGKDDSIATKGSPRLTIPICGANYVKPRIPKPPTRREVSIRESTPPAPVSRATQPNAPVQKNQESPVDVRRPSPLPASAVSLPPAPPCPSPRNTQPALSVLMKMHEQTAQLHRQFLEGQESALRTLESLARGGAMSIEDRGMKIEDRQQARREEPGKIPSAPARPSSTPAPIAVEAPAVPEVSVLDARLLAAVLEVVSEKTGYPSEMLKPEMSLDHDLGIDSIKRVEILSALQERRPDLPAVKPEQLGTLHRLQDVIELLSQAAGDQASMGEAPSTSHSARPLSLSP
ncbi:MAG: beta-ketoacyl synthase N-terminal-like domain-containing protein [Planctomycetaceae bacterium]